MSAKNGQYGYIDYILDQIKGSLSSFYPSYPWKVHSCVTVSLSHDAELNLNNSQQGQMRSWKGIVRKMTSPPLRTTATKLAPAPLLSLISRLFLKSIVYWWTAVHPQKIILIDKTISAAASIIPLWHLFALIKLHQTMNYFKWRCVTVDFFYLPGRVYKRSLLKAHLILLYYLIFWFCYINFSCCVKLKQICWKSKSSFKV